MHHKWKIVRIVALMMLVTVFIFPLQVSADTVGQCRFYGTLTVDGSYVDTPQVVTAFIEGVKVGEVTSGSPEGLEVYQYRMDIPADDLTTLEREGGKTNDIVDFKIGGWDATPTGTWLWGQYVNRNLSATTPPVAECEWSNLSVDPTDGVSPLEITASADVTNIGGVAGSCTGELKVDGTVVDSETVSVDPSETKPVTFTYVLSPAETYTYSVTINELAPVSVVVEAPLQRKGDFDNDRDIDFDDFDVFCAVYGLTLEDAGFDPVGDFNNDNVIDFDDFDAFCAVYGT